MSYYATPIYLAISSLLCLSYSCIECTKDKGDIDNATKAILSGWCVCSVIVASIITAVVGEMMVGMINYTHLILAFILALVTLCLSSSILYYS